MNFSLIICGMFAIFASAQARADYSLDLVYAKCTDGRLAMSLTNRANYPLRAESEGAYPEHLFTLSEFAEKKRFECKGDELSTLAEVTNYYPASPRGQCGAKDKASMRFAKVNGDEMLNEAWVRRSHGNCGETDRLIFIGPTTFSVCTKPNDPKRDPTLLDMTGYDCVELEERN